MKDISEPMAPTEVGFFETSAPAMAVVASGNLALVAEAFTGLRVIDFSDPTSPREVGFLKSPIYAEDIATPSRPADQLCCKKPAIFDGAYANCVNLAYSPASQPRIDRKRRDKQRCHVSGFSFSTVLA